MKTFIHPFAFCLYPFRVTPFPYIRLRSIKFNAGTSYFSPRFAIGEAEVDRNANPALNGFVTIASRNKPPALDRFRGGAVQRLAPGAVVDLNLFGSTMIVNQHTEKHSPFTTLISSALRVSRSRCFAVARSNQPSAVSSRTVAAAEPRVGSRRS